nr:MAG TPA: minor tail protein [Caudoviricetes sp.]
MSDGQILIDSKLDTQGVQKGADEIQGLFIRTAETAAKAANNIENAFKDVNYKEAFEKLPASLQSAYAKIETIRANDALSEKQRAKQIAEVYEELGYDQESAMERAWDAIQSDAETGSHHIIENLYEIQDAAGKTGEETEKSGEKAKGAGDAFRDMFKAHLSAEALIGTLKAIARELIELGKQAVAAAADVAASNAQFEQTFSGVEKEARKSLNSISKETGITATRMQGSFTKIFAFTKSAGGDTEAAMDIASRALRAAADSAAYYDRSVEETTESLLSFLKGNYANDAALGIAATETTRNTAANKKYAKSFNELSEAQKVDVLLSMVEAGNEASGAIGQAAREAEQWTNVTGELSEAWKQFLAKIGTPILEALTPIIQGITSALQRMSETSASADLAGDMKDFTDALDAANTEYEESEQLIEHNAIKADLLKQRLEELAPQVSTSADAARNYATVVDLLNEIYPELNLQIDEQTGLLTANSKAQLVNIDAMKQKALYAAKEKRYSAILEAQAEATLDLYEAQADLIAITNEFESVQTQLQNELGYTAEELDHLADIFVMQNGNVSALTAETKALLQSYVDCRAEIPDLNREIAAANDAVSEQDALLAELENQLGDTTEGTGQLSDAQKEAAGTTAELTEEQKALAEEFQNAKESAADSLSSTIGLFDKTSSASATTYQAMRQNMIDNTLAMAQYRENLQKAMDMGFATEAIQKWADGSTESMAEVAAAVKMPQDQVASFNEEFAANRAELEAVTSVMAEAQTGITEVGNAASTSGSQITNEFVTPTTEGMESVQKATEDMATTGADTLKSKWEGVGKWFETNVESPLKTSIENIGTTLSGTLTTMQTDNETAWKNMYDKVNEYITNIQSKINSLQGKTFTVTIKNGASPQSGASGSPAAVSPQALFSSDAAMGIPYLASGAVIPPNAPFMAVLGDQRNGTNLEAPEDLLRKIVREEIGEINITTEVNFEGTLAQFVRALYPEIKSEAQRRGTSLAKEVIM